MEHQASGIAGVGGVVPLPRKRLLIASGFAVVAYRKSPLRCG